MAFDKQRLTKREAFIMASAAFATVIMAEGFCALQFIHHREILVGSLVFTSWFRDGTMVILEHLFFDA